MLRLLRVPGTKGQAGTPISMNATFMDRAYNIEHLDGYSICAQVIETVASLAGTLKLQASNNAFMDNTDNQENPNAIWVDVPSTSVALTAGSTNVFWDVSSAFYEAFRVSWTRTTGSGNVTLFIIAKGQA